MFKKYPNSIFAFHESYLRIKLHIKRMNVPIISTCQFFFVHNHAVDLIFSFRNSLGSKGLTYLVYIYN